MSQDAVEIQRILIADDQPVNLQILEALLQQEKVEIIKATSGQEAIDIAFNNDISLVLLDVVMPDLDGYDVAKALRANPATKYIPILFVTGSVNSESGAFKSYQSGAVDILYKPIQPEVILAKVKIFLELDMQRRLIKRQRRDLEDAFEQLKHYAQHDQLTGLFNREQITDILSHLMAKAARNQTSLALFFLDLDHFKHVNDSLGHDVGDLLLKSVADRIKSCVRESDFVARLGGDEFAVILSQISCNKDAGHVAQKILDKLVLPHQLKDHEILVSSSIGIAIYNGEYQTSADLLKSADVAMYQAKQSGRSQFKYFSPYLQEQSIKRMEIARSLNDAIDNDELSIFYQPQISAETGKLVGFEALMRWSKNNEWISPALFIPIAEETGLIPKMGEWILRTACQQLKHWQDTKLLDESIKMAVNVSIRQIQASNFVEILNNVLKETKLPAKCLEIELTESTVMDDPEGTISIFNQIHELGVEISVDDFGTGYSSLNYLRHLPIDCLKIDQSFVKDINLDKNDEAIVKAIIGLSHNLGLTVVAEGVETETQSSFLRLHACDILQGYLFSRPIPAHDIFEFLKAQQGLVQQD